MSGFSLLQTGKKPQAFGDRLALTLIIVSNYSKINTRIFYINF